MEGSTFPREAGSNLGNLAEVAQKLEVERQALQQRKMPLTIAGGLYRIDEVMEVIIEASRLKKGPLRPRFNLTPSLDWFRADLADRRINA